MPEISINYSSFIDEDILSEMESDDIVLPADLGPFEDGEYAWFVIDDLVRKETVRIGRVDNWFGVLDRGDPQYTFRSGACIYAADKEDLPDGASSESCSDLTVLTELPGAGISLIVCADNEKQLASKELISEWLELDELSQDNQPEEEEDDCEEVDTVLSGDMVLMIRDGKMVKVPAEKVKCGD